MMEVAQSAAFAGQVGVLITNEGVHSAEAWAKTTAEQLVTVDAAMPLERRVAAKALIRSIENALRQVFHEVRADSSLRDLECLTRAVTVRIVDLAAGTPWQINFGEPSIRALIEQCIKRNLVTMANIALETE